MIRVPFLAVILTLSVATSGAATDRDCPHCPEMVSIPPGSFVMGDSSQEEEREKTPLDVRGRAGPSHTVTIAPAFSLGRHEVTRGQYKAFALATGHPPGTGCWADRGNGDWAYQQGLSWSSPGFTQADDEPVVCVSWYDAKAYVAWLSTTTGKPYRLPSEAEWEYAARAGTTTSRYWGDGRQEACRYGNVGDRSQIGLGGTADDFFPCYDGYVRTAPVGRFEPNAFGLHDMLGNVWEFVEDCWIADYRTTPPTQEARADADCGIAVLRGGGWASSAIGTRSAHRLKSPAAGSAADSGFRVARTDAPDAARR